MNIYSKIVKEASIISQEETAKSILLDLVSKLKEYNVLTKLQGNDLLVNLDGAVHKRMIKLDTHGDNRDTNNRNQINTYTLYSDSIPLYPLIPARNNATYIINKLAVSISDECEQDLEIESGVRKIIDTLTSLLNKYNCFESLNDGMFTLTTDVKDKSVITFRIDYGVSYNDNSIFISIDNKQFKTLKYSDVKDYGAGKTEIESTANEIYKYITSSEQQELSFDIKQD